MRSITVSPLLRLGSAVAALAIAALCPAPNNRAGSGRGVPRKIVVVAAAGGRCVARRLLAAGISFVSPTSPHLLRRRTLETQEAT